MICTKLILLHSIVLWSCPEYFNPNTGKNFSSRNKTFHLRSNHSDIQNFSNPIRNLTQPQNFSNPIRNSTESKNEDDPPKEDDPPDENDLNIEEREVITIENTYGFNLSNISNTSKMKNIDDIGFNASSLYALIIIPFFLVFACFLARKKGVKIEHFFKKRDIRRSKSWPGPQTKIKRTSIDSRVASSPSTKSEFNSINTSNLTVTF